MKPIDFSHRLEMTDNEVCVSGTVIDMTDKATGILYSLSCQFEGDVGRINDNAIACTLYAVIDMLADIRAVMKTME